MRQIAVAALAAGAAGHGWINEPPSRTGASLESAGSCPYGACLWFSQSCTIGCPACFGSNSSKGTCGAQQGKATLPQAARTYKLDKVCGLNPWCAPGSAPIMSPCGVAGGGAGGDGNPPGYEMGVAGTEMPELEGARWKRTYKVGDAVDMAWSVIANHGGGYQYRLCPKAGPLTETCFQKTPLEFVGDEQYIQYAPYPATLREKISSLEGWTPKAYPPEKLFPVPADLTNRTAIPAVTVSTGTVPAGSQWRRNPVPACKGLTGGGFNTKCGANWGHDASDYQFPPPTMDQWRHDSRNGGAPFPLGGFGQGSCGGCGTFGQSAFDVARRVLCRKDGPHGPSGKQTELPSNCSTGFDPDGVTPNGSPDQVSEHLFWFSIVDKVRIPDVPPGEYVVSWRWDCEQSPQIWSQCSDVTITA